MSTTNGNFAAKHKGVVVSDERISMLLKECAVDKKISCAEATKISQQLSVEMSAVGITIDMLNIRIIDCQMGIFGVAGKTITAAVSIDAELKTEIHKFLQDGRLACASAWEIAKKHNTSRKSVAQICEALKIKIKPCQLGAF